MPTSKPKESHNTDPSDMTYEVTHFPSFMQTRVRLAAEAEGMTMADLKVAAREAQINTAGATTKEALVAAVKQGASGTDAA